MNVPDDLARILAGRPGIGTEEQAFPFLTVDAAGFPHVALLSRAEVDVRSGRTAILAVVASPGTRANLQRDGRAVLLAVGGTVAHSVKLDVVATLEDAGLLGCVLGVSEHKRDSLGIPLAPISFRATEGVAQLERWEVSARALQAR